MNGRPALLFFLLLSAGIVAGRAAALPPAPVLIAAGLVFAAAAAAAAVGALRSGAWPILPRALPPLLVVLLGGALVTVELGTVPPGDPARFIGTDTLAVRGSVGEVVSRRDGSIRFLFDCDTIAGPGGGRSVEGRILVRMTGSGARAAPPGLVVPGRRLELRGPVRPLKPARNPGEPDWAAHYRLSGVRAALTLRAPGLADSLPGADPGFFRRAVVDVRRELSGRMTRLAGGEGGRLLNGLILGERNEVPSELRSDFVAVGVMHLLAISGQQVVLVALLITGFLTLLRIPRGPRFFVAAAAIAYYVLLTGASPSVTRAGIMSAVVLGASVAQRRPDVLQALGVAGSAILLYDPLQLFDPGFVLSFAAVFSIVLLAPLILAAAPRTTALAARRRLTDLAWKGAAVSLAAGIGTAPIVAWYFGRVSLVGFAANLLVVPLSSLALVLGVITLAASFVSDRLAAVYAAAAEGAADLTVALVRLFAEVPWASVDFRATALSAAAVYLIGVLILRALSGRSWKPAIVAALAIAAAAVYVAPAGTPPRGVLRVTFLDVGQGDAAFLQFPGGASMLVDGGPPSAGAAPAPIPRFLRHLGVDRLEYLVLSHPHADHLGGYPALVRSMPVGAVVEGPGRSEGNLYREFERAMDSAGTRRLRVAAGDILAGELPARIYVLSPGVRARAGSLNDASLVLRLQYGSTSLLLTGDAEAGAEGELVGRFGSFLDADLLKAGHHGSATSTTQPFLELVTPAATIVSAGEGNRFGHPSPAVLGRLAVLGGAVHRTDLGGAAVYESDGRAWRMLERGDWP